MRQDGDDGRAAREGSSWRSRSTARSRRTWPRPSSPGSRRNATRRPTSGTTLRREGFGTRPPQPEAHDDADPGFPDRFLSARDVDASTGDRADALADERHAREEPRRARQDRGHAANDRARAAAAADKAQTDDAGLREGMQGRTVIGQAQGLLMARLGIGPDEAFALLVSESQGRNLKLRDVARLLVHDATSQPRAGTADDPDRPAALGAGPSSRGTTDPGTGAGGRSEAADERDRLADQRENDADDRELRMDERDAVQRRQAHATDRQRRAEERAALGSLLDRSAQAITRSRARLAREEAADRREARQDEQKKQDKTDHVVEQPQVGLRQRDPGRRQ